jgi:hypothetical protein
MDESRNRFGRLFSLYVVLKFRYLELFKFTIGINTNLYSAEIYSGIIAYAGIVKRQARQFRQDSYALPREIAAIIKGSLNCYPVAITPKGRRKNLNSGGFLSTSA